VLVLSCSFFKPWTLNQRGDIVYEATGTEPPSAKTATVVDYHMTPWGNGGLNCPSHRLPIVLQGEYCCLGMIQPRPAASVELLSVALAVDERDAIDITNTIRFTTFSVDYMRSYVSSL
jgi:hypothetical protein